MVQSHTLDQLTQIPATRAELEYLQVLIAAELQAIAQARTYTVSCSPQDFNRKIYEIAITLVDDQGTKVRYADKDRYDRVSDVAADLQEVIGQCRAGHSVRCRVVLEDVEGEERIMRLHPA